MSERHTFYGMLTLLSPLHITSHHDGGVIYTEKVDVVTQEIVDDGDGGEDEQAVARFHAVPIIPGNTIRGRIRRAVADIVLERLAGERISVKAMHVLRSGSTGAGNVDKNGATLEEMLFADAHPVIGLLGGGPRLFPSRLVTDTAVPLVSYVEHLLPGLFRDRVLAIRPIVRDDGGRVWPRLTAMVGFVRRDDIAHFAAQMDMLDPAEVQAYLEEVAAKVARRRNGARDGETGEDAKVRDVTVGTRQKLEVVLPGLRFGFRVEVRGPTPAQLGLTVRALERFAADARLGGWVRAGCGRFALDLAYQRPDMEHPVSVFRARDGNLTDLHYEDTCPELVEAVQAWEGATVEAADLEIWAGESPFAGGRGGRQGRAA